ncbi:DUF4153 domain-containing protein [Nocardiopsis dassonvillei]|uniref:DUF4153 domain-containing protein n=1 Tax=Nocardiopsis dassonvillei TaxID=2014 RepID=UPI0033E8F974
MGQARPRSAHQEPQLYGTAFAHLSYAQHYQQTYHDPAYRYRERPRVPLPRAPAWLPVAVLGVGVVAALLATFDRPGIGLVITGAVAGLTAFAALMVRPAIPESGMEDEEERSGEPGPWSSSGTAGNTQTPVAGGSGVPDPTAQSGPAQDDEGARSEDSSSAADPGVPDPVAQSGPAEDDGQPRPENPSAAAGDAKAHMTEDPGLPNPAGGHGGPRSGGSSGAATEAEDIVITSEAAEAREDSGDAPSTEAAGKPEAAEDSESDSSRTRTPGSEETTGTTETGDPGEAGEDAKAAPADADETAEATGTAPAVTPSPQPLTRPAATASPSTSGPQPDPTPQTSSHPAAPHATASPAASVPHPSVPHSSAAPAPDPEPTPDRYSHTWSAVYGLLAAALLFTAVFRDAGWVLLWTLTASFLFASMAFAARNPASRQGAVGVVTGSLALVRNLPSTPRFLAAPLQSSRSRRLVGPVLVTTVATVGLLLVFGVLFAFADPVFGSYLGRMFTDLFREGDLNPFGDLFAMVTAMLLTGSAVLAARRRHAPRHAPHAAPVDPLPVSTSRERTPLPVWVWTIPLGALVLLFTAFLAVQAVAMFGGDEYVQRVAGVTYAEYARQGFFQLVVVSLLILCVIAVVVRILPSSTTRVLRNVLLGLLCALTLVILASAMLRLQLYIDAYGLTRMRASAEAWIVWSAGVFGLLLVAGALDTLGRSAAWLPRVTAALAGTALAVFAYGNPDLRIAESHQDLDLSTVDTWYLRDLSADAIPGLLELEGNERDCALVGFQDLVEEADDAGFASWNLSRHWGLQQLDELGLFEIGGQAGMSCSYERGY